MITPQNTYPKVLQKIRHAYILKYIGALICFFALPLIAHAQIFSIDDSRESSDVPTTAIFAGIEPIDFDYKGDASAPGAGNYSFSGSLIRLQLETPNINFYLGTGGSSTGLGDISYFDAGVKFGGDIELYEDENEEVILQVPLLIHTSITNVSNDDLVINEAPEFAQGTLEFGAGLNFSAPLAPNIRIGLNAVPSYGFSFSTREQDAGGSILAVEGRGRLYFDQLFGRAGLSLGYDYNFREFSINDEALDYNSKAHSILIGITF